MTEIVKTNRKSGRKPMSEPRNERVVFRVSGRELNALQDKAQASGMNIPNYARHHLLGEYVREAARRSQGKQGLPPKKSVQTDLYHALRQIGVELRKEGGNLHQVVRALNIHQDFDEARLESFIRKQNRVLDRVLEILNQGDTPDDC